MIRDFQDFLTVDLRLEKRTLKNHCNHVRRFLKVAGKNPYELSRADIRNCLLERMKLRSQSTVARAHAFDEDPDFVIIMNMVVAKRKRRVKRKRRSIRDEVPLPKSGPLAPFTHYAIEYLNRLSDPDEQLFKFGRHRAWQIVRFTMGKWCHYFRSQGESWYGKIFSNIFALKDFVGVVDASTLSDYVKTDWKEYRDRILGKTR